MKRIISKLVFVALVASLSYTQANAQNVLAPPRGMVGQPVCGVPADEAVLLTRQLDNGEWRIWTPVAGSSVQTHSTEADAIGLWEQQNPAFVCEVTIQVNLREFTGKFYRLNRKMQLYRATADGVYAGEEDPRELIVGVRAPTDGGDGAPTDGGQDTADGALNAEDFSTDGVIVSNCAVEGTRACIENRNSQPAFVRFCTPNVDGQYKPALCVSVGVRANDGFIYQGSVDHVAEIYWRACALDNAKGAKEQACYFDLP